MKFVPKTKLALAIAVVSLCGAALPATADTIVWTDWSGSANTAGGANVTATGTMALGSGVTVTYIGQLNSIGQDPHWPNADATYNGGNPGQSPATNLYSVEQDGNNASETFRFSQAVSNPYIAIWSLGQGGNTVGLQFSNSEPFSIKSCGTGSDYGGSCITQTGNTVYGAEGNGTIQLVGDYSSITFDVVGSEHYFALQVGSGALASTNPGLTPEPSSLMLMGTGALATLGAVRRKLKK